jgi:hypothetical protein
MRKTVMKSFTSTGPTWQKVLDNEWCRRRVADGRRQTSRCNYPW